MSKDSSYVGDVHAVGLGEGAMSIGDNNKSH